MTTNMSYCLRLLLMVLLFIRREVDSGLSFRKFVYQKDMSEYCRRRVMPSVFLGRQVVDAYSQILHFSRLELPYSCFVSIRTESGSNIILVVQISSEKSVIDSCRDSRNQLLVYGIGETFGGYWGALPDNVMKPEPATDENRYTLKTTQPTTTTTTRKRTTRPKTTPSTTENLDDKIKKSTNSANDIVVEVPLVNVSAVLVPGDLPSFALFDAEKSFDSAIDVKPESGVSYKTTVLPLVQFAISDEVSGRRTGDGDDAGAPRYEMDLSGDWFTPDARLSYPRLRLSTKRKQRGKYKYNVNSRLDFKKNKKLLAEKEALFFRTSHAPHEQPLTESQSGLFFERPDLMQRQSHHTSNPYDIVDAILKNLSKTKDVEPKMNLSIHKDVANLLQGLGKTGYNESVFLVPNASWYTRRPVGTTRLNPTKHRTDSITWRQPPASYSINYLEDEKDNTSNEEKYTSIQKEDTSNEKEDISNEKEGDSKSSNTKQAKNNDAVTIDVVRSGPLLPLELDIDRVILNVTQQTTTNTEKSKIIDPETLASQVGFTTAATTPDTKNYLEDVKFTSNVEGLSDGVNKSSITMQTMNKNDSGIIDDGSGRLLPLELDVDRVILDVTQRTDNIEESITMNPETLASQVSGFTTAATKPDTKNYLEYFGDVKFTSNVEGLSDGVNKASITMQTMNKNDSGIIDDGSGPLLPLELDVDRVMLDVTKRTDNIEGSITMNPETLASEVSGTTTTVTTPETMKPMTLVDHESWENMVQAASMMAVVLNQSITSVTSTVDEENHGLNVMVSPTTNVMGRKKRFIHAIPINFAKPHHLPVKVEIPSSPVHSDKISDAQEFQRLIELQDDEIHDRVALRYLRQYVGPALFNICSFDAVEPAAKYTILFNSSRLVLAITNFTLDGMSVVMTPARTLLRADSRCSAQNLECQVLGARVCIDSLNACDGVANCGSYDVYDEDRLMCGASAGLQHNVCLAAITFLAVLLTLLYTIHYWLKRCVPKVSDAFFIYTDAAENILYLDPIMRSPHDTDDPKDIFRSAAMHEYLECDMRIQKKTDTFFTRLFRFLRCKRKKELSRISSEEIIEGGFGQIDTGNRRFFSFAEVELGKMGSSFNTDVAVQTGSSLEMQITDKTVQHVTIRERMTQVDSDSEDIVAHYEGKRRSPENRVLDVEMIRKEPSDELSILQFFRRARSVSMQMSSPGMEGHVEIQAQLPPNTEEKEIQCLEYDHCHFSPENVSVIATIGDIKPEAGLVRKRIRFEEEMKTRQVSDDDDVEEELTDNRLRRSVVFGGNKNVHLEDTDSHCNVDEPSTSTGNREFKSYFWGGGKSKPKKATTKKKKQQLTLR